MSYTGMKSWLADELRQIDENGLFKGEKIITTAQGSRVDTRDGVNINFCANNYLGLADHPDIIDAVTEGMRSHGFGMASVRFICGTQDIHKTLEERISEFLGTEDTILYTSCFDANTGLFETLLGAEDVIISDGRGKSACYRTPFGRRFLCGAQLRPEVGPRHRRGDRHVDLDLDPVSAGRQTGRSRPRGDHEARPGIRACSRRRVSDLAALRRGLSHLAGNPPGQPRAPGGTSGVSNGRCEFAAGSPDGWRR